MKSDFPPPSAFGLPAKFQSWRPDQVDAALHAIDSDRRFIQLAAPTGFGKSLAYMLMGASTGKRMAILTGTKGLQSQLLGDFNEDKTERLVDIRGQNAYQCVEALNFGMPEYTTCDYAPCHAGRKCDKKSGGCRYYDAYRKASKSAIIITNYAYWMSIHRYGEGLSNFDLLILDEAHDAPDSLSDFLSVTIDAAEAASAGGRLLDPGADIKQWKEWGEYHVDKAKEKVDRMTAHVKTSPNVSKDVMKETALLKRVLQKLTVIATMQGDWIKELIKVDGGRSAAMKFDPMWPQHYAEPYLFLKIPKVVMVSATIRPKTAHLLGIESTDLDFREYDSSFPAPRRRVIHVPTCQMNFRTPPENLKLWVSRMDQIISRRLDKKGIIHTVSFKRANYIMENSDYAQYMVINKSGNTRWVVEQFKRSDAPSILVSPSLSTGWDFPYDQCEYQIIGKIPFPDSTAEVVKARMNHDKEYSSYIAMQNLIQMCGRGMRAANDMCEVLVIDDNITWFIRNNKKFAPKWFLDAVIFARTIPDPPPKLNMALAGYCMADDDSAQGLDAETSVVVE